MQSSLSAAARLVIRVLLALGLAAGLVPAALAVTAPAASAAVAAVPPLYLGSCSPLKDGYELVWRGYLYRCKWTGGGWEYVRVGPYPGCYAATRAAKLNAAAC